MKTACIAAVSLLAVFPSCEMLNNMNPTAAGGGQGQSMVDSMKSQPTLNVVSVPPDAKVGTWWELSMAGGAMKMKYCVVAEMDGKLVVENPMQMGEATIINAYLVDPGVDMKKAPAAGEMLPNNVSKAWVGLEGGEPVERPVMGAMKMPEGSGAAKEVEHTEGTETLTLGGREWNARWYATKQGKSWMLEGSSFPLRAESGGKVAMELSGYGDDAKPLMNWTAQ